jgi:F-type H+-transporting ATPase subunit epsilon
MILNIVVPTESHTFTSVEKVSAQSREGAFTILPRHLDYTYSLVPGLLSFTVSGKDGPEYIGIDTGILVKIGNRVLVSTQRAVMGEPLGNIRNTIEKSFLELSEREKKVQTVMLKIETDIARRIFEMDSG